MAEYEQIGTLYRCAECTTAAVEKCTVPNCQKDHRVLVVDPKAHDRFHVERGAQSDPNQAELFG